MSERREVNGVQEIHDLVRTGQLTPEQGAWLLEVRRRIIWKRKPWWKRAVIVIWRMLWQW